MGQKPTKGLADGEVSPAVAAAEIFMLLAKSAYAEVARHYFNAFMRLGGINIKYDNMPHAEMVARRKESAADLEDATNMMEELDEQRKKIEDRIWGIWGIPYFKKKLNELKFSPLSSEKAEMFEEELIAIGDSFQDELDVVQTTLGEIKIVQKTLDQLCGPLAA